MLADCSMKVALTASGIHTNRIFPNKTQPPSSKFSTFLTISKHTCTVFPRKYSMSVDTLSAPCSIEDAIYRSVHQDLRPTRFMRIVEVLDNV